MDINGNNISHSFENHCWRGLETSLIPEQNKPPAVRDDYSTLFINYAAIAWNEMRRAWRGDQSCASQRKTREPISSRSNAYEDYILSKEPFGEPVPLSEMVEILVESWEEEGLFE